jgi:3-deoxy-manno-octulosonate cytidylyltransferase (CMP-KDO synthetase)
VSLDFVAVIPARYASTRLPGKPLADIHGRPMVAWVHERALRSGARTVIVATDDERIARACRAFDARVEMTAAHHASGTDRIAEVAERLGWSDGEIVVNVQGDEPLLPPALIAQAAALLDRHADAAIATLVTPLRTDKEWHDPNTAKVVVDRDGYALYFSRAPIPRPREGSALPTIALRHLGLYAYRAAALRAIAGAPPCALEQVESLEQLRALWLGYRIVVEEAVEPATPHVETAEDLAAIRLEIERRSGRM